MKNLDLLNGLIEAIAEAPTLHGATTSHYRFLNALCQKVFRSISRPSAP